MKSVLSLISAITLFASVSVDAGNKKQLPISYLTFDGLHAVEGGVIFAADGFNGSKVYYITPEGTTFDFAVGLDGPIDITNDKDDNLYVTNFNSHKVSKISATGEVSTFAEVAKGPSGIASDSQGNLYVSHFGVGNGDGNSVSKISSEGVVSVFSQGGYLNAPVGTAVDEYDNVYVANLNDGIVVKINQNGEQEFLAQIESDVGFAIGHLSYANGHLYATGIASNKVYIIKPNGKVKVLRKTKPDYYPNGLTFNKETDELMIGDAFLRRGALMKVKARKKR